MKTDTILTRDSRVIEDLHDHFLIATAELDDSYFSRSVIYICSHEPQGTMGMVVNRPMTDIDFEQIITNTGALSGIDPVRNPIILNGGPVDENRGFVIHSSDYIHESTQKVSGDVNLSANSEIVSAIATGHGPKRLNFCLGYAGWGPSQLEDEIADNAWLVVPADAYILFDVPLEQRYEACLQKLGLKQMPMYHQFGLA